MTPEEKAKKLTIKIFRIILEEFNGFSKDEIRNMKLAEEHEGHPIFEKIKKIVKS